MLCVFVRTPLPRQLLAVPLSAVSRRVAVGVHGFRATASASVAARTVTSTSRRVASYDRALCTTFGIVSGGVAVTSALKAFDTEASNGGERIVSLEKIQNWYRAYEPDDFTRDWNRTMGRQMEDDSSRALAALIGTNIGVFLLWRVSPRFPGLNQFMWRHFACSYQAVAYGKRVHTLFTSAFSHITVPHLAINMFMLWEFGRHILAPSNRVRTGDPWYDRAIANSRIAGYFGSNFGGGPQLLPLGKFLTLYAGSALSSSALSVIVSRMRGTPGVFTIGASGAVMGIFTLYCLMFPQRELMLYGFINLTAAQMLQLTTAVNMIGSAFQRSLRIDCVGHLGGQGTGWIAHEASNQRS